ADALPAAAPKRRSGWHGSPRASPGTVPAPPAELMPLALTCASVGPVGGTTLGTTLRWALAPRTAVASRPQATTPLALATGGSRTVPAPGPAASPNTRLAAAAPMMAMAHEGLSMRCPFDSKDGGMSSFPNAAIRVPAVTSFHGLYRGRPIGEDAPHSPCREHE